MLRVGRETQKRPGGTEEGSKLRSGKGGVWPAGG